MEQRLSDIKYDMENKSLSYETPTQFGSVKKKSGHMRQHLVSLIVGLLPLMFGAAIGWSSTAMAFFQTYPASLQQPLTADESSLLGSLIFAGGIVGTLIWSRIAEKFGRKIAGYSVGVLFLTGWTILTLTDNKYALLSARFITGIGGTGSIIICPLYISEIADDSIRGTLGSYTVLLMNVGTLYSYLIGAIFSYRTLNVHCMVISLIFLILYSWLPETPVYWWKIGNPSSAENSLNWLKKGNFTKVQEEIIKFSTIDTKASYKSLLSSKANRMGMLIGLGIFAGQQYCGILALLTYLINIFEQAGASNLSTILVGLFLLIASALSTLLVERVGRKVLLMLSFLAMGLTLTMLGIYFYLKQSSQSNTHTAEWIPVVMLSIYMIVYSLGAGPLPYVVINEIISPEMRAAASSIIIFWGTVHTFICVLIFPYLLDIIGIYGCFWFFASSSYLTFLFIWLILPETKSLPLSDIQARLSR